MATLRRPSLPACALCLLGATTAAQGPVTLLTDVEAAAPNNPGSMYQPVAGSGVAWNGYLWFAADGDGRGAELWRSNGTAQNATLVVDLQPDGGSSPQPIGVLGGWLLFTADDGRAGRELWRTDGTQAGTQILADLTPGEGGSFGTDAPFVRLHNHYYFLIDGRLWRTDGTPGNTFAVSTTQTGAESLVAGPTHLWMPVATSGGGELWASDGSSSVYLAATLPAEPTDLAPLAGIQVLFACDDGIHGTELWRSDGTQAGTQMLVDLEPGATGSGPLHLTVLNGAVCFRAAQGNQVRLWRSDGTQAGTFALDPAVGPRFPEELAACGNRLWFRARPSSGANVGTEVWTSDGTIAGTTLLADVWPGSASSGASGFAWDGSLWTWFSAHDGSTGYELWRSDGTTALTQRVSDIVPGFGDGSPVILGFANGYCLCAGILAGGAELFASQGNATQLVRDIRAGSNGDSDPQRIVPQVGGGFFFTARRGPQSGPGALGREPHFSSGAPGSGQLLVDAAGGASSGGDLHTRAASFGPYTWFNTVPGSVLWRTAGTVPSTNAIPGFQVTFTDLVTFQGRVFVDASTPATGEELFAFADPLAAPVLIKDIVPGSQGSSITNLTVVGSLLFFAANDGQGNNLWCSDGTTAGTRRVWQNSVGGNLFHFRAAGRRLFFDNGSNLLLVSDGTTAGTTTVGTLAQSHEKVAVGNRLFLAGEPAGANTGLELCVTDGSTISLVKDIRPGQASSQLYALAPFGDGVLFVADDGVHGFELWRSDGTPAGTQMVIDLVPGLANGCPRHDAGGNGYQGFVFAERGARRALFAATDGTGGIELWRTDGTQAGTALHAEIQPGPLGSFPSRPVRAAGQLLFAATRTEFPASPVGRELFALPTMAIASPIGTACSATPATAPLAASTGAPFLGNAAFALTVDAAPNTAAVVAIGDPVETATGPCELRVANFVTGVVVTNGSGAASFGLSVPATPALAGLRLGTQWGVLQTGGPYLGMLALSNGVELIVQAN